MTGAGPGRRYPLDPDVWLDYACTVAGRDLTPNNELNNVVFCGVGRATTVDHVQGHLGADDCIEWFGGTVNSKFMIASACGDDGFDSQLGTDMGLQFGLIAQRTGKYLTWDAPSMRITNDADANALVAGAYRAGWCV